MSEVLRLRTYLVLTRIFDGLVNRFGYIDKVIVKFLYRLRRHYSALMRNTRCAPTIS
jgi:hypothetical protein